MGPLEPWALPFPAVPDREGGLGGPILQAGLDPKKGGGGPPPGKESKTGPRVPQESNKGKKEPEGTLRSFRKVKKQKPRGQTGVEREREH